MAKHSVNTKKDLVESAIEVIEKKGYSKTTLEDIAKNIGMTRGAFYWHYKDKSEILAEILIKYREYYDKNEAQRQELESARDTIRNYIIRLMRPKIEGINKLAFLFRYNIEASTDARELIDYQRSMDNRRIVYITEQIKRGIKQQEFSDKLDPDATAMCIYTSILGFDNYMMLHWTEDYLDDRIKTINIFKQADFIMKMLD